MAAALCLCRGDLNIPPQAGNQVVVLGLLRTGQCTIHWASGQLTCLGVLNGSLHVRYDRLEGRWMARRDNTEESELNPRGGQELDALQLSDGAEVTVLFSGDIR